MCVVQGVAFPAVPESDIQTFAAMAMNPAGPPYPVDDGDYGDDDDDDGAAYVAAPVARPAPGKLPRCFVLG